jgi:hypothetical protein
MEKNLSQALTFLKSSLFLKRGLLLLAIACAAIQFSLLLPRTFNRTDPWRDVLAYYLVKERIHNGEPVYIGQPESGPHDRSYPLYLYPPILATALSALPKMTFTTFARLWTLLLYGAFWIYAAALGKLSKGKVTVSGTLIAGMILLVFPGTFRALDLGQVDPLLWAAFGLALSYPSLRGVFPITSGFGNMVVDPSPSGQEIGCWPAVWLALCWQDGVFVAKPKIANWQQWDEARSCFLLSAGRPICLSCLH